MSQRYGFPKSRHVRTRIAWAAVFAPRVRVSQGPIILYGVRNQLKFSRLGLSTPRHVGNAVRRNRIRRLLREAYRHIQHELPVGYDWVAVVRQHELLTIEMYQQLLRTLASKLHAAWERKSASVARDEAPAPRVIPSE